MASLGNFNAANVEITEPDFDLIPAGKYLAEITDSEMRTTKSGYDMLVLTVTITDSQYANRKIWYNVNIGHSDAKVRQIAESQLAAICHAVGVLQPQDSTELHNKKMQIKVGIQKSKDPQYDDQNKITAFKQAEGSVSPVVAASAQAANQTAAAMPWGAKA